MYAQLGKQFEQLPAEFDQDFSVASLALDAAKQTDAHFEVWR